ncbi:MAG: serine hydrolase [Lachnospiraceae bacterium]|nr:class A beta-lactamase-related serine hydrolase [Robinsoniella sp.]MDY3766209.1 serine hydrolase [Lachnospiraceae bacterium]
MKNKRLWALIMVMTLLIVAESGMIISKIAKKGQDGKMIPTIQAETKLPESKTIDSEQISPEKPAEKEAEETQTAKEETQPQSEAPIRQESSESETSTEKETDKMTEKKADKTEENQMAQLIAEKVRVYDGIWSVYVKTKGMEREEVCDIYSEQYGRAMKSASLIKLFVMETLYDQASQGMFQSDEIEWLIQPMITVSDNTACNTLVTDYLGSGDSANGMAQVTWYAQQHGYEDTSMGRLMLSYQTSGDNYTSARDCGRLLEKIYDKTCVNSSASEKMLSFLQNQERRNKIPYALQTRLTGQDEWVANKTGEIAQAEVPEKGMVEGDAAIVHTSFGDYILCILVNNMANNGQTQADIQELSGWVYDYLAAENR